MLPALMAKNSRGRPNCRHGSQLCQSGWLSIATRNPAASSTRPRMRHREAGMIDVGVAGDEDDVDLSHPRASISARVAGKCGSVGETTGKTGSCVGAVLAATRA